MPLAGIDWFGHIIPFSMRFRSMLDCERWLQQVGPGGPQYPTIRNQERLAYEVPLFIEGAIEYFQEHSTHKLHPSRGQIGQVLASRGDLSRPNKMLLTRMNPATIEVVREIERCFRDGVVFTRMLQCEIIERVTLMKAGQEPGVYLYQDPVRRNEFRLGESKNIRNRSRAYLGSASTLQAAYLTWDKKRAKELQDDVFAAIDEHVVWRRCPLEPIGQQGALAFERGVVASEFIHEIMRTRFRDRVRRAIRPENLASPDEMWNREFALS